MLSALIVMMPGASKAQVTDKEVASCAAITGDLARLECFDELAMSKGLSGPQAQPVLTTGNGKWEVGSDVNPVDDSKTVTLFLTADSGSSRVGTPVILVARCKSNSTDLFINWSDYLGSDADVLTRVGDSKAVTRSWALSTDSKATFHPSPIAFLKEMLTSQKLVAQVTPYNENPVTAVFSTGGLENAIKPLRETCKW